MTDAAAAARHAIEELMRPSIRILRDPIPQKLPPSGSYFGGAPRLPAELPWPTVRREGGETVAMTFLCQIDLSALPSVPEGRALPERGLLYFFANTEFETLPLEIKDPSVCVLYADASRDTPLRAPPDNLMRLGGVAYGRRWPWLSDASNEARLDFSYAIQFEVASSYPHFGLFRDDPMKESAAADLQRASFNAPPVDTSATMCPRWFFTPDYVYPRIAELWPLTPAAIAWLSAAVETEDVLKVLGELSDQYQGRDPLEVLTTEERHAARSAVAQAVKPLPFEVRCGVSRELDDCGAYVARLLLTKQAPLCEPDRAAIDADLRGKASEWRQFGQPTQLFGHPFLRGDDNAPQADARLLLQICDLEDMAWQYGTPLVLQFWMRAEDLAQRKFRNVRAVFR